MFIITINFLCLHKVLPSSIGLQFVWRASPIRTTVQIERNNKNKLCIPLFPKSEELSKFSLQYQYQCLVKMEGDKEIENDQWRIIVLMYHLTLKSVNVKDIFMVFSKENLIFWAWNMSDQQQISLHKMFSACFCQTSSLLSKFILIIIRFSLVLTDEDPPRRNAVNKIIIMCISPVRL